MEDIKQGYKQTDIGVIPKDWEVTEIEDICKSIVRGPFGGALKKEYFVDSGFKVYEQRNAIYQNVNIGRYYIDSNKFSTLKRFEINYKDFIVSCSGTIGRIYQIPKQYKKGIINQALLKLTVDEVKCDTKYFYYVFVSNEFQQKIIDSTQGGAMKNLVGMPIFKKTPFELPKSLTEQSAIATVLSDTDTLIAALNKKIAKKHQIKQGAMQQLLTGKKRLPGFSGEWVEKRLGSVTDISRGGSPRPIENYLTNDVDGVNWIKIGDVGVNAKFIESTEEKIIQEGVSRSRFVKNGDFLLSNSMSFGRPYILKVDGCIHDGWLVIQNYQETFNIDYLYYMLGFESTLTQYKSVAAGSSVLNLNKQIVSNVLIFCPQKTEQTAIAQILTDMDNEIAQLEKERDKYKYLKAGMMQVLLTGKVRLV